MYSKQSRREFIKSTLLNASLLSVFPTVVNTSCNSKSKTISGGFIEDNASVGHLLRQGFKPKPTKEISISTLIIGAGISGLSAAHHLHKNNVNDFLILDLASRAGGNSASDRNSITSYPWAAHYLPIVNNTNIELLNFLREQNIITGFDAEGLPIYNDYYLCFDPEDRLYINGYWQDGLIPNFGVPDDEKKEIARFFNLIHEYKYKVGADGKSYFDIPVSLSSNDENCRSLDSILFSEFLSSQKFTSPHLLWYLNYCCKDDYGSTITETSAYAGLHYFCARRAKASNAEPSAVLTWPEGNNFLVEKLLVPFEDKFQPNILVTSIDVFKDKTEVITYNTTTKESIKYSASYVVLATPQYINQRLISADYYKNISHLFEYTPWMVANISVNDLDQREGEPLSWDNVIYNSASLGYVNACHQLLNRERKEWVITYYLPLTHTSAKHARKIAREKTHSEWVQEIITDLKKAHPYIEQYITNIDIKIWGHGMIKPKPNVIFNQSKNVLKGLMNNNVFFAHTDLSGISIFEEGFYQGVEAAKKILALHDNITKK